MRPHYYLLACAVAAMISDAAAQDYILRPGPRGFDPRLNRYGATEAPATPARSSDDRFNPSKTSLSIEILMPREGNAIDEQQWSKTLADMGFSVRMRSPLVNDKIEVTERTRGPLRFVTVVGALDPRGRIVFPDRSFTSADADELKDWLNELKSYGAQGSPEGRPLWGLSRPQFETVYAALARPVKSDVQGLPLTDAIAALGLPKSLPFHFNAAAKQELDAPGQPQGVARSVSGITAGTALAFVLNEYGLGFHPERLPDGNVELLIQPLPEAAPTDDRVPVVWPVGWQIDEKPAPERRSKPVSDAKAVPSNRQVLGDSLLQQREAIGLTNVSIEAALKTIETETGVPMLVDRNAVATAGIDLAKTKVSVLPRNTSWNLVLKSVTLSNRLRHELRRDEAGNPVVFITSLRRGR
jgi:hypothetical protein